MNGGDDRGRWLEGDDPLDRELARMLDAGRDERPSAARRQHMAERLAKSWRTGSGGGGAGGGVASSRTGIALVAVTGAVLVAVGVLWALRHAGAVHQTRDRIPPAVCSTCEARVGAAALPTPASAEVSSTGTGEAHEASSAPAASMPAPSARAGQRRERSPADPLLELHLLDQASRALASSPALALTLTQRHARLFPRSQLNQERELIAIEALVRSGARERARRQIARFLTAYPGSSHAPRVRELAAELGPVAPEKDEVRR